jgi:hypothetical protein
MYFWESFSLSLPVVFDFFQHHLANVPFVVVVVNVFLAVVIVAYCNAAKVLLKCNFPNRWSFR